MTSEIRGSLDGTDLRIGIVAARFNRDITSRLLTGARAALAQHGVSEDCVTVASVPGSFEIPLAASKMAGSGCYSAVVCLGAVIRGETDHYQHIAEAASHGVARAGLDTGVPVVFGVLTTDTFEQALARAGGVAGQDVETGRPQSKPGHDPEDSGSEHGNIGFDAVLVAIEMANLMRALDSH
jgi:6,7-dimethyl-8-ribityllumazine synthase